MTFFWGERRGGVRSVEWVRRVDSSKKETFDERSSCWNLCCTFFCPAFVAPELLDTTPKKSLRLSEEKSRPEPSFFRPVNIVDIFVLSMDPDSISLVAFSHYDEAIHSAATNTAAILGSMDRFVLTSSLELLPHLPIWHRDKNVDERPTTFLLLLLRERV